MLAHDFVFRQSARPRIHVALLHILLSGLSAGGTLSGLAGSATVYSLNLLATLRDRWLSPALRLHLLLTPRDVIKAGASPLPWPVAINLSILSPLFCELGAKLYALGSFGGQEGLALPEREGEALGLGGGGGSAAHSHLFGCQCLHALEEASFDGGYPSVAAARFDLSRYSLGFVPGAVQTAADHAGVHA